MFSVDRPRNHGKMSETQTSAVDPARAAESRVAQIVGVTTVFHVLALIIVILRSYTRLFLVRSFAFPDAFMILSVVRLSLRLHP